MIIRIWYEDGEWAPWLPKEYVPAVGDVFRQADGNFVVARRVWDYSQHILNIEMEAV